MLMPMLVAMAVVAGDAKAEPSADGKSTESTCAESKCAATTCDTAVALPAAGALVRLAGGDATVNKRGEGESITFSADGVLTIDTPLPVGYPDPTPPGAIDLKNYPSVRRAEVSGDVKNLSGGGNEGFWPLFRHIQRRDIAMTSPVEMEYRTVGATNAAGAEPNQNAEPQDGAKQDAIKDSEKETWTMAFLYRRAEQGDAGKDAADKRVTVTDTPEMLVISIGMKGDYSRSLIEEGKKQLDAWLATQTRFEKTGEARALYYHGPSMRPWRKWAEVQYPVREVSQPVAARADEPAAR
jgi:hypothetical protein